MSLRKKLSVVLSAVVILALTPAAALAYDGGGAAPHPSCVARSVDTPCGGNESIGIRVNFGTCQAYVVTSDGGQIGNEYAERNPSTAAGLGGQVLCNPAYFPPPPV